jgi:hypothetical protein
MILLSLVNIFIAIQSFLPNTRHTQLFQFLSNTDKPVVLSLAVPTRLLTYLSGRFPTASNDISFLSLRLVFFISFFHRSFPHAPVAYVIGILATIIQKNSWILQSPPSFCGHPSLYKEAWQCVNTLAKHPEIQCDISDSYSGDYEELCLLKYKAVYPGESQSAFRKKILPLSSGSTSKQHSQPAYINRMQNCTQSESLMLCLRYRTPLCFDVRLLPPTELLQCMEFTINFSLWCPTRC